MEANISETMQVLDYNLKSTTNKGLEEKKTLKILKFLKWNLNFSHKLFPLWTLFFQTVPKFGSFFEGSPNGTMPEGSGHHWDFSTLY